MTVVRTARVPFVVLALALALLWAGCGSSKKPASTSASASTSTSATTAPSTTATTSTTQGPDPKQVAKKFKKPAVGPHGGAPPDQLEVKDVVKGNGETLEAGDTAIVNYVGVDWRTGKQFDSSWQKGRQPLTIPIDQGGVIAGWWQGMPGMKVGGRRTLVIPAPLGYGKNGQPPTIKPNETLYFVVDLLGVQKAKPAGAQGAPQPAPAGG